MNTLHFARAGFVVLFIAVTYLTLTPNPDEAEPGLALARWLSTLLFGDEEFADKVAHLAGYGALGGSAAFAKITLFQRFWLTPFGLGVYGAVLEGAQAFGGVRTPELYDALANASGALLGFSVVAFVTSFYAKRPIT